jgi:tetratricopeptide (TPR) repeat protein
VRLSLRGHPCEAIPARALAVAIALTLLVAPVAGHADASWSGAVPAKARALAERGRAFHDAGDYAHAIAAFTQAYVMAPSPALLFNLAQAYRLQGDCDDAALMYERYLATNPSTDGRVLAETHLANVERCLHKLALHIPVESAPSRLAVPAPPVAPALTATATATATVPRKAQLEKDIGLGLAGGGGVALAVAVYFTMQAHDAETEVADAYARGAKWKDIAPIDQRGKTAATDAKIFGIGGALGLAGGLVTYMIGRHTERTPVAVAPTRHGVEVSMLWAF